jgi:GT2 family glycosyltransferase
MSTGDKDMVHLSIIVVSYNTRDTTIECLRSVLAQTGNISYEIVVVDNASHDGSADAIERDFPKIKVLKLNTNIGFARANNLAVTHALGSRILLLNPDTVILDHAIDSLVAFADRTPSYGIWGGRTIFVDGTINRTSCWRRTTLWNLSCFALGITYLVPDSAIFNSAHYGGWNVDTTRHVDVVCGCFFLIERSLWNKLGGFDETFFMFGEDDDLCFRAYKAGARPAITPEATIIHHGGASHASSVDRKIRVMQGKVTSINHQWAPVSRPFGSLLLRATSLNRLWVYRVAAGLTKNSSYAQHAEEWRAVWLRRKEWRHGYPRV